MNTYLVFVVLLLVAASIAKGTDESSHHLEKRQAKTTIHVKPPPGCIFYECIASCRQRGYKNGGL
ncbi:uncharacterized protein LOC125228704 [Leguminivora glycinivorella]|uniref:uncharacterized protein LOC125228704 n=1 Tax=Leguminivora glycinivorella TaxID=1035111 RepID=UPI0020103616|nr:uncharacterized protein LOC125228704 [Leguminivora glycinivorella]